MKKSEFLKKLIDDKKVEFKHLWEVTNWDKKFKGVEIFKQKDVLKFKHISSRDLKKMNIKNGTVKLLSTGNFDGYTNEKLACNFLNKGEVITIPTGGTANIKYYKGKFVDSGNLLATGKKKINTKYIYYFLLNQNELIQSLYRGSGVQHPDMRQILEIIIPIPPITIQKKIVRILDKFTKLTAELTAELTARKKQYNYYRDKLLTFDDDNRHSYITKLLDGAEVECKTLGWVGEVRMCKRIMKNQTTNEGDIPFFKIGTFGKKPNAYIPRDVFEEYREKYHYPKLGDILISASGTIGRAVIFNDKEAYFQDSNIVWIENDERKVLNKYLFHFYKIAKWHVSDGGVISRLYNDNIKKTSIPIPSPNNPKKSLKIQKKIVRILDKFDALTNSISEGLPREIELRQKQYEYYRDLLLNFPKPKEPTA